MEITESVMTSAITAHTAWRVDEQAGTWRVSWLSDRLLSRNDAITAMTLAETVVGSDFSNKRGGLIRAFAGELGMTADDAVLAVEKGA